MSTVWIIAGLALVAVLLNGVFGLVRRARGRRSEAVARDVAALGEEAVPASIHPVIDLDVCIGSGACVNACPEHDVIGLVRGKARLVNPLGCVGHGACAAACPVKAIELVFGTAKRGLELPLVDPAFQTERPGIYVVGELAGMGLIRNAIKQGRDAAAHIVAGTRRGRGDALDAIVVGAGPAGLGATLALLEAGLRTVLLEREEFGGTIRHYPRKKVVMTGALDLPGFGKVRRRTMSKEELIELWEEVRERSRLPLVTGELVSGVAPAPDGAWIVHTSSGMRRAANVVLALGRRGSPRKLGVPGEDLEKVCYRLTEAGVFAGEHVLVVGGGNAAAESVLSLVEDGDCASVTLSYRRAELARLRGQVRDRLQAHLQAGRARALLPSQVVSITSDAVELTRGDGTHERLVNDAVIVQIGGTPPGEILASFGIGTVVKYGEA